MGGLIEYYRRRTSATTPFVNNLFIGDIGDTITDATTLATRLGISSSNVVLFNVDGNNNIQASIDINVNSAWSLLDAGATYFVDIDGNIISNPQVSAFNGYAALQVYHAPNQLTISGGSGMRSTTSLKYVDLPSLTGLNSTIIFRSSGLEYFRAPLVTNFSGGDFQLCTTTLMEIYIPRILTIGSSPATAQGTFQVKSGCRIYVNPTMLTVNGGAMEADLQQAITTYGATVIAVLNETKPSAISDLSVNTITTTTVNVAFTAPSSANALNFYEVYYERQDLDFWHKDRVVGRYNPQVRITASGTTITGLVSGVDYVIKTKTVDEYGNRSDDFSNEISFTTL